MLQEEQWFEGGRVEGQIIKQEEIEAEDNWLSRLFEGGFDE